ncbi:cell division protein ZapA [Pseudothauera rhizosphaerae]|uniref:Cell division protein ZapA n=1 Tax=Pseudothauera rhizosphaerae TaxID=2565932 RepID=A0A4S4AB81_9RHOO|nr:cell division protein ZapA [Pseudothauera rhizosphaerae]THF56208.1 cell division protein ZapA [Pseudothauera rhizosphaerae]
METLDIKLLGKEYQVSCRPDEREGLLAAVEFLDGKLADVTRRTGSTGERLAIMTALNVAHELLQQQREGGFDLQAARRRIGLMTARLDGVLAQQEKLF